MAGHVAAGPVFAIGDVHGCADELDRLLGMLPLKEDSTVVFLGDYIDRGPKSRQVVDRIIELRRTHHVITLQGNHEAMLFEFLDGKDPNKVARFVLNGGSATLAAYASGEGRYDMPPAHMEFFKGLQLSYETPSHFFVHAGVPNIPLSEINPATAADDMLWIRNKFLLSNFRWEKLVVHGHTSVKKVEIAANRINLDTGCVFGRTLSAMEFPAHRIYSVERSVDLEKKLLSDGTRRQAVRFHGAIPVELNVGGETLAFQTVDYSEIGLGVRALRKEDAAKIKLMDAVSGRVGVNRLFQIPFKGKVVRVARDRDGEVFGLVVDLLETASELEGDALT